MDEHYYQAPEWFMANMHRYANYPENGPRVFLGEYASWGSSYQCPGGSRLYDRAEKAPAVGLACYAPLLSNADYQKWYPDLIYFNNHQAFGSACYYVQKLFMNHQGDDLLAVSADHLPEPEKTYEPIRGKIVVVPTKATVQYKDFELVDPHTGMVRKLPDVLTGGASLIPVAETEGDFILRFTAVKLDESNQASPFGERGLEIRFGWQNEDNYLSWRIGAWQNQDSFLRSVVSGKSSDLTQSLFTVKEDVEYRCELRVTQRKMSGIINGSVINEAEDSLPVIDPLYYTASLDRESGDIIVKVVNLTEHERRVTISLEQYGAQGLNGTLYEMKGYDPDDENSFDDPKKVAYTERPFRAENLNSSIYLNPVL